MQSIERAMKIIKYLISNDINHFYTISDLSKACNIPLSSMHRILNAMIDLGMITKDTEKKLYGIGPIWLEYGLKAYDTMDYVSIIRPELENLMKTIEASVYLTKRLEKESIIIERIDNMQQNLRVNDQLGLRLPLHTGVTNEVILAFLNKEEQQKLINDFLPEEARNDFVQHLNKIKHDGYTMSTKDSMNEITTFAAPILNRANDVEGAISVRVLSYGLHDEKVDKIVKNIITTAHNISRKMGYNFLS